MSARRPVTLVGVGDDGCRSLNSRAIGAIGNATVLVGGARHLEFFPEFSGERVVLKSGLSERLQAIAELSEDNNVVILASGDPLFFGVGALVLKAVGPEHVEILPQPSSVQLAFAAAGLPWSDARFFSVHGRPLAGLANRLRACSKAAVLTDATNTPQAIAKHLLEFGHSEVEYRLWVCENLSGPGERVRQFSLGQLSVEPEVAPLNVLLLQAERPRRDPVIPFLPEEAFARRMPKKGLITKQEVRLLSLAKLGLRSDSVVWDIGAGSGSVAIEAARLAREGKVYAVEVDPEGAQICRDNARQLGTDNVVVVEGRAPEALVDLPDPDAVFVGGSKGSMASIVHEAVRRLAPGGHLVVNAITLENVAETYAAFRAERLEVDVRLVQISRAVPLARYLRFEALNPIHIFSAQKPLENP